MTLITLFIQAVPLMDVLLDEKPPAQVFVHVSFRVLILGGIIGLTYLGRRFFKRLSKASSDVQDESG
jgi:hypothetical protein